MNQKLCYDNTIVISIIHDLYNNFICDRKGTLQVIATPLAMILAILKWSDGPCEASLIEMWSHTMNVR